MPTPPKRRDRRLQVDRFTDAELDELARITPDDIARAAAWWEEGAEGPFRDILHAAAEPPRGTTRPPERPTDGQPR